MSATTVVSHGILHGLAEGFGSLVTAAKQVTSELGPIELPPVDSLIKLHIRGWIDDDTLRTASAKHGVSIDVGAATVGPPGPLNYNEYIALWNTVYAAECEIPSPVEMREIVNRQYIADSRYDNILKRYGYKDSTYRSWMNNLRYDIPDPADLVRFSVRHVWEPDLIKKLDYNEEFPGPIIDMWHAMKGLDYPLFTDAFKAQVAAHGGAPKGFPDWPSAYAFYGLPEPTWARAYWWSHWVLPSPGQFFEMLIRLDPNRDRSFDSPEMVGLDFFPADFDLGLRANDYPPKYRKMLAAINRPIVGVRFLRGLVHEGVYDYDAVIEWARRWGYSPRDQKDIADLIFLQEAAAGQKRSVCRGCATCDQAFEIGLMDQAELDACYQGYGADPADAARMAAQAVVKLEVKRAREMIANIRKRFLRGTLTEQQARGLMSQFGIKLSRQDQYIIDWQIEFETGRKELSAAQAVKAACNGFISVQDLILRLTNLGYPQADQDALVREAALCSTNLAATQAAKQARLTRQQQADAYTAARRARQSLVEAQRYLASHGTPKQLHDWFCQGVIGEPEVYTRLNALGWPNVDIGRFLSDCKSGRKPSGAVAGIGAIVPPLVPPTGPATAIEQLP